MRYSTPDSEGAENIAVYVPAFSPIMFIKTDDMLRQQQYFNFKSLYLA
ncbi:conserved domain protein (plasmid) [Acaryochloris marina MBIC11017]|uniref:Conserved domain protein n=1 Tax=Acaryochloris marina (strain MBIC 11017) TaxID=329726 RepID=A8ZLY8_ACAM1|nr:conserved domain protein [Acaryochloris marina MBIC11017]